jgi:hypothetical protein
LKRPSLRNIVGKTELSHYFCIRIERLRRIGATGDYLGPHFQVLFPSLFGQAELAAGGVLVLALKIIVAAWK